MTTVIFLILYFEADALDVVEAVEEMLIA